jgi:tRNA(fMet)-specific endonuclease VapC
VPFLIDTNIAIHLRDGNDAVIRRFLSQKGSVLLSALSLAELQRGLSKDGDAAALRQMRLEEMLRGMPVVAFDAAAALAYGRIIAQLGWSRGRDFDRMIAAHAIATRSILATNNVSDFRNIPGLQLEDWT